MNRSINFLKENKLFLSFIIVLLSSHFVWAQTTTTATESIIPIVRKECEKGSCTWQDFIETIQRTIRALLIIGYWIAALVAFIGAFLVMFGGYKEENYRLGKSLMISAVSSYILLLLAGVIFDLVLDFLKPKLYIPQSSSPTIVNYAFAQNNTNSSPISSGSYSPSPLDWDIFYKLVRPWADVKCATGTTALDKISNCVITVTKALRALALILIVITITYTAGLFIFSPWKAEQIGTGKKIIFWSIIGFIVIFIAEQIMKAIKQLTQ